MREGRRPRLIVSTMLLVICLAALGFSGCGETAKPFTPASANLVNSYFGSPFSASSGSSSVSVSKFDHSVGEIGVTGSAGAVANAVWHATGVRVRKFPITLDRLIEPQSH